MATAAQIQVFNNGCCGGASNCEAVAFAAAQPGNYQLSLADIQSTQRLQLDIGLTGTPPFTMEEFEVSLPVVDPPVFIFYMVISGNVARMTVDFNPISQIIPSGPWPLSYRISNCAGDEVNYAGQIEVIP